jgi:TonB family protein
VGGVKTLEAGSRTNPASRSNPVAQEIPINATGTRPGDGSGKRELFSEETDTVLLFPDGAVIRLTATVDMGQLIFLTNKKTNREVVCQVLAKRNSGSTTCYVELQFTEPIVNFWGIAFPAPEAVAKDGMQEQVARKTVAPAKTPVAAQKITAAETAKTAEIAAAVEMVESYEEITEDAPEAAGPSEDEVEHLREEVEVLRQHLRELTVPETNPVVAAQDADGGSPVAAEVGANGLAPSTVGANVPARSVLALDNAAPNVAKESPAPPKEAWHGGAVPWPEKLEEIVQSVVSEKQPASSDTVATEEDETDAAALARAEDEAASAAAAKRAQVAARREAPKKDPEEELLDEILPKPALDFTMAGKSNASGEVTVKAPRMSPGRAKSLLGILSAGLAVVMGIGAWQMGLLGGSKVKTAAPAATARPAVAKPAVKAGDTDGAAALPTGANGAPAVLGKTPPMAGGPTLVEDAKTATGESAGGTVAAGGSAGADAAGKTDQHKGVRAWVEDAVKRVTGPHKGAAGDAEKNKNGTDEHAADSAPAVAPEEAPVVPAKLLKSAQPVYPPDAMRSFITGDVKLKAELDARGKVGKIEVVSGPSALREAAQEALKQYQYAPATKAGKGVPSEVQVVIKFWFDP